MPFGFSAKRLISLTASAAVATGAMVALPAAASAATVQPQPSATTWGAWKGCPSNYPSTDNCASVRATAENPTTHMLWVAGDFSSARNSANGSMVASPDLMEVHTTDGTLNTHWPAHTFNGMIYALAVDIGRNTLYAGGNFTSIDGSSAGANHVAAFDMTSGAVKRSFDAGANDSVRAITYDGGTQRLYIGGRFTAVHGVGRTRLAAVDPSTGALSTSFVPPSIRWTGSSATQLADVRTLAVGANQSGTPMLYVGGHFDTVNGAKHPAIVRVNLGSGALDSSFSPPVYALAGDNMLAVMKIVYLSSGYYPSIVVAQGGHYNRAYRFTLDGRLWWTTSANGDYQAAAVSGGTVYFGGHFQCVAPASGSCYWGTTNYARTHLAAVNVSTGAIDTTFDVRMSPITQPYFWGVWTLQVGSGGTLWAAGDFNLVKTTSATYSRPKLAGFRPV